MTVSEVDLLMKKVLHRDKYNWGMIYNRRNQYGTHDLTKEEWEAWVIRNPNMAHTSKEAGVQTSSVANKHIGIKRERGPR